MMVKVSKFPCIGMATWKLSVIHVSAVVAGIGLGGRKQFVFVASDAAFFEGFARPFADGAFVLAHHLGDVLLMLHAIQDVLNELLILGCPRSPPRRSMA
jgi:hypothetical protein